MNRNLENGLLVEFDFPYDYAKYFMRIFYIGVNYSNEIKDKKRPSIVTRQFYFESDLPMLFFAHLTFLH